MNNLFKCQRLVEYSSDEEVAEEASQRQDENNPPILSIEKQEGTCESLPLPLEIQEMYKDAFVDNREDDSSLHGGKIRSFAHERGIWATYVYIQYDHGAKFFEMIKKFQTIARSHGIDLDVPDNFHVSLSRTVKLRHHWIQPFIDSLKINLCNFYRFKLMFQSVEVYENEEKTRTFLGLKVHLGFEQLLKLTKKVDTCLKDFQLPCFYDNPSFHLSCAFCVGSKSEIIESFMPDLNILFQTFVEYNTTCRTMWVTDISCKSGNKLFTICLKT